MKKVIGILALLAFTGNFASAELLKNFKADGKVEVNAYNTNNADFNKKVNDKTGKTDTRVMINAGFDLNDDVSAVVSAVKCDRQYGTAAQTPAGATVDIFTFEQAYLNLKGVLGLDHKLGRQYYGEAGDMVVYYGPAMWPYTSKITLLNPAIDGWTSTYKYGNWDFGAIIAKQLQSATVGQEGKQDINLSGFNAMTTVADVNLKGYVYQKVDNNTSAGNADYLDVLGLKAKYAIPMVKNLNVAGEYAMNMGKMTNGGLKHKGFAYKANADYGMNLMGKLGFDAEYYFATGDNSATDKSDKAFKSINGDYRPGIMMGGGFVTGINGTSTGNTTLNVGANWTYEKLEKLNIAAKYYDFSADKKGNLVKTHIGTETDVVATWTHSDNVNVKGYYAMFQNEKKNKATDDAETMMGAAVCVKF
jgi:hypothetical protein